MSVLDELPDSIVEQTTPDDEALARPVSEAIFALSGKWNAHDFSHGRLVQVEPNAQQEIASGLRAKGWSVLEGVAGGSPSLGWVRVWPSNSPSAPDRRTHDIHCAQPAARANGLPLSTIAGTAMPAPEVADLGPWRTTPRGLVCPRCFIDLPEPTTAHCPRCAYRPR